MNPTVSVIIPCYNQAHFLPEAVESVVSQTFTSWECIIVNDGSPDKTNEVAQQLIAKYPNKIIRLLEKLNGGLADARNAGITISQGIYWLPLDADDALAATFLEKPFKSWKLVLMLDLCTHTFSTLERSIIFIIYLILMLIRSFTRITSVVCVLS